MLVSRLRIGLGDEALIYVPALGETLKGRVSKIDRTSGFVREQEQRQNPGYAWRGPADRSAKVTIVFDDPAKVADVERYRSGLPVVVVSMCLAVSALYELLEWGTALATAGGATAFLGTQGDPWDTQWDMFLALVGACTALLLLSGPHDRALARARTGA